MKQAIGTFLLLSFLALTGCVSADKYNAVSQSAAAYQKELNALKKSKGKMLAMTDELETNELKLGVAEREIASLQQTNEGLEINYNDLMRRYDELLAQNKALLSSTSAESLRLRSQSTSVQTELDKQYRENQRLQRSVEQMKKEVEAVQEADVSRAQEYQDLGAQYALQQKKMMELQMHLDSKEAQIKALQMKMNQALVGFSNQDLQISESNGKLSLTLSEQLMFTQNSFYLDQNGKNALNQIAQILKTDEDFEIIVEGHTDADAEASQHWKLSVDRATEVVKHLISVGVNPKRIIAAGRGYHAPITNNSTEIEKAKNRRTEIILSPKLDRLYEIINQ